jgi:hypothetical protein
MNGGAISQEISARDRRLSSGPRSRRRRIAALLAATAAACFGATMAPANAQTATQPATRTISPLAPLTIVGIRAGFAGRFKVGYWTPLEVTIEGGNAAVSGRLEVTVLDGDAVPSRTTAPPGEELALAPGEKKTVSIYAKIGQLKSDLTVGFRSGNQLLATRRFSTLDDPELAGIMPSGQALIVALGSPLSTNDELPLEQHGIKVANVDDFSQLPADWWGYEGVDAVILATGGEEISTRLTSDSPQLAALELWVRMGGKLILGVGRQAEKVLAPTSPLRALAPGSFEAFVPLRQSAMLETYAEASALLDVDGPLVWQVPKLRDVRGKIEVYAGNHPRDLPLVVRSPHGFGEIVFAAFDLERAPLAKWSARPQLVDKLLRRAKSAAAETDASTLGQVATLGFVDLAGQLQGALDQFPGVPLVPFWLVAVLVSAYIVCIGPLDYFIVKKLLRRMEATWLTFTITVVVFSGGAWALAYGFKGRELRVNQVDLVDFDAESSLLRGTSWTNVFSPKIDTYNLSLEPLAVGQPTSAAQSTPPHVLFSWLGLPGSGFGGMDARSGSLPLFTEAYAFSATLDRMHRVPIAIWSSRAFVGRWWHSGVGQVEAQLSDRGKLVGTLTSHADLDDAVLIYDRWAYPLRQLLMRDRPIDIETQLDPQTVDTYLRHVTAERDRNVAPPYDRGAFDIPRIVEIMTAYELAGGANYTGLAHEYQAFVDLSGLVKNGRAILIGRSLRPGAELDRDEQPLAGAERQQWTFFRYVFPVKDQASP